MVSLPVPLPEGFTALVSVGEAVTARQKIAERVVKEAEIVNIASDLNVPLKKAKKLLKKNPGDMIRPGDVLAVKQGFLGFGSARLVSKVNGIVDKYERDTGNLVIKTTYESVTEDLISPVAGIVALCDNERIVIETDRNVLLGIRGSGATGDGELFVLEDSFGDETESANLFYLLDSDVMGKILVGGHLPREVMAKGIGVGAKGIISTRLSEEDVDYFAQRRLDIPVIAVDKDAMGNVVKWKGKKVFLDGMTKTIVFLQM